LRTAWATILLSVCLVAVLSGPGRAAEGHPWLNQKTVDGQIAPKVSAIRGLDFLDQVPFNTVTRDELRVYVSGLIDEEIPPRRLRGYERLLAYLGLAEPGLDLRQTFIEAATHGIAAFYNEREKCFAIVVDQGSGTALDAMTTAHELVHALQDQHFDLSRFHRFAKYNDDATLAFSALSEGDACDVMLRFQFNGGSEGREGKAPGDASRLMAFAGGTQSVPGLPPIFAQDMIFPYSYGSRFVSALLERGGSPAVDRAFRDPPVSTEQIIDPERYFSGDEPSIIELPDIAEGLPEGWHLLVSEPIGQFNLSILLATHIGEWSVDEATRGWDGDVLACWENTDGEDIFIALCSTWDSPEDAVEFFAACDRLASSRLPRARETLREQARITRVDGGTLCYIGRRGSDVLYVENAPLDIAGYVITRLWEARKVPFGVARPVADGDRAASDEGE
jgi:hypothetical protein